MDMTASKKHQTEGSVDDKVGEEGCTYQVVMRNPRSVYEAPKDTVDISNTSDDDSKMKKHVKWSQSTEMRERLKVCRRSQLDMPLDYHHLAIEEEREKEGVHLWRNLLKNQEEEDDEEISKFAQTYAASISSGVAATAAEVTSGHDGTGGVTLPEYDSDENDPDLDEDMEKNFQIIKEETTRFTLFPAYSAAIAVYEEWLSNSENTKQLTEDHKAAMKSQLELYKRLVDIYKEWTRQTRKDFPRESRFGDITSILQEASNLGQPPSCVSKTIREVLTDEENIQKQVDAYNSQVQEMIAALDIKSKV